MKKAKSKPKKTPKKRVSTRPSSKKNQQDSLFNLKMWRIGYFILGVLILTTNFAPNSTGFLGYWLVSKLLYGLLGDGILIIPFYCFFGYFTCLPKFNKGNQTFVPICLSFFSLLIAISTLRPDFLSFWLSGYPYESGWLIDKFQLFFVQLVGVFLTFSLSFFLSVTLLGYCMNVSIMTLLLQGFRSVFLQLKQSSLPIQILSNEKRPLLNIKSDKSTYSSKRVKKENDFFSDFDLKKSEFKPLPIPKESSPPAPEPSQSILNTPLPEQDPHEHTKIQQWIQKKEKPHQPAHSQCDSSKEYQRPSIDLLKKGSAPTKDIKQTESDLKQHATVIEEALGSFNVEAHVINITAGPSVTRFELQPGRGVKISKITALSKDIALKLAAPDVRIEAPIPGKALIGIEVPNLKTSMITMRTVIDQTSFYSTKALLTCALGVTINGDPVLLDIQKTPHLLIAGATGSGKSVCINTIILSILMRCKPDEVKMLMIDPKKVELSLYDGIPHLIAPVVTNPNKAAATLKQWALSEMERRYETFSRVGVKSLEGYNAEVERLIKLQSKDLEKGRKAIMEFLDLDSSDDNNEELLPIQVKKMPYILVIIDELADLMMVASQEVENTICRLAQMARATGIHLVIATQRPSVNVITGLIKANVPSRISFFLQSQIDSRTILDSPGAEKLLGKGDLLYLPVGGFKPKRIQGVFVSEKEVKDIVSYIKLQGTPDYDSDIIDIDPLEDSDSNTDSDSPSDDLYEEAKKIVMSTQYASTSYLQRKLRIGYNRAARLMDELEENGVISPYDGEKKSRKVIVS